MLYNHRDSNHALPEHTLALTRFSVRQIEAFVTVAETRGFSAAAGRMGLTSQAISQLVAELESIVDLRLFERTTRRVALTAAGHEFLDSAQSVLRHIRQAESAADDLRHRAAGVVRIAATQVLAGWVLPAAIRHYQTKRPKVVVRIRDSSVEALTDALLQGDVDLAIGPDRPIDARLQSTELFDSPWVLWCAARHPLARAASPRKHLHWEDLREHPLVAAGRDHEGSVARMHLSAPASARIIPVDVVDNISTALGIAAQGHAATLAPAYVAVAAKSMGLVMRRVTGPETVRKVCLYQHAERRLSSTAAGFAEELGAWMQHWHHRSI